MFMTGVMAAVVLTLAVTCSPAAQVTTIAQERRVKSPDTAHLTFELPEIPKGQQVRLGLRARVDWTDFAGFNPWMVVRVNGHTLDGPDLVNKPVEFMTRNGVDFVWVKGEAWTILYSPDFSEVIRNRPMPWGFPDVDPYHFVWDVTRYVKAGKNTVSFTHLPLLAQGTTLVLQDVQVEIGDPVASRKVIAHVQPAPEGPLPIYIARGRERIPMRVELSSGGAIRLQVGGKTFSVASRTSEPEGRWADARGGTWAAVFKGKPAQAHWSGTGYQVTRSVTLKDDHIHVTDAIANTSDKLVGVIYQNRLDMTNHGKPDVLLCGRPVCSIEGAEEPGHPSAIALWKGMAMGLFAEDDILRVHVRAFSEPDCIGLADPRPGIAPGKSHTLEWSIYPAPGGNYWDVLNGVRRNWGSNRTIPGPALFDHPTDGSRSQEYFDDMVHSRKVGLVFSGQTEFKGEEIRNGVDLAEGTAIPLARKCAPVQQNG